MHVVIVGAGIAGLCTAFELRSRGVRVTLCDPDPAGGASHAAAGMLAPAAEIVWGQDRLHQMMADSAQLYPELVARVQQATGATVAYRQNPTMVVAAEAADRQALAELEEVRHRLGLPTQMLLGSQARRREPALAGNIAGALVFPEDHQVDPRSLTGILIEHFGQDLIREQVSEVEHCGATARVHTQTGRVLEADQVLLATGLGQVPGTPRLPLRAVHGDILRLHLPAHLRPLLTHTVRGVVHRRNVYLVPRSDGSIVLGASSREDGNDLVSVEALYTLLDDARRLVPGIMDASLREVIARPRPGTPDDRPIIDRVDAHTVVSNGFFRHGVLLAPLGARIASDLLLGADPGTHRGLLGLHRFPAAASSTSH
ncbi:glycine oxidase ThiO [Glutamicibacter creatinolyticus]|uniref:glycine oxidase ThiO n=1 Tax=Glutamicibacter creatinolyticus TaxID=162496 RepID=UPI0037BEF595